MAREGLMDDAELALYGVKFGEWITDMVPREGDYILLSLRNFSTPLIGRYEADVEGGAFYEGDDDKPLTSYGLFVNAWMPLPNPYRGE